MISDNPAAPLVYVVEDDSNHADLIHRSFENAPEEFRLAFTADCAGTRAAIEAAPPSLVITDFRLPDGYGSDLVISANGRWPVIIMTSHGNEQIAVESMKIGAHDYIVKSPDSFSRLPHTAGYALKEWSLIVARRQADEAAIRAKKEWERTFDAVPDMITIIDTHHTIVRANRAMAERFGMVPAELIGRHCYDVVHALDCPTELCLLSQLKFDGKTHHMVVEEKALSAVFDVTVSPLLEEDGTVSGCVHLMRDITDRVRIEEERKALEKTLQHAQKLESLGVLAGGIAHDFNNILSIILSHCYVLGEVQDSGAVVKNSVEQIESAATRASDLCAQLLAYAGKNPLNQKEFSVYSLVDEIVKLLKSVIPKNIAIKLEMPPDIPLIVGDSGQIQQVAMNLIINAGEAIGTRTGIIRVGLDLVNVREEQTEFDYFGIPLRAGSYVCLTVADTGCGMSEETMQRIFEPFFTTKFTGRGLGMSAILGIIKSHEGALQVTSSPGAGTTFKVYVPAVERAAVEAPPVEAAVRKSGGATVLIVDDEEHLRSVGATLLESFGFTALTACNGSEAVELYRERGADIDLVILDMLMPVMGGVEAYTVLRSLDPLVPVIICSGYGVESVADAIQADRNAGFLQKPYKPKELSRILHEMLGR